MKRYIAVVLVASLVFLAGFLYGQNQSASPTAEARGDWCFYAKRTAYEDFWGSYTIFAIAVEGNYFSPDFLPYDCERVYW